MKPVFPSTDPGKAYVFSGATLQEIFAEISRCMPQAGEGLEEEAAADGSGVKFNVVEDPGYTGGMSGTVNLPGGCEFMYAGSTTTVGLANMTFTDGLLTEIGS